MGRLNKDFDKMGGMDGLTDAYNKKKKLLENDWKKAASAELRYMFDGAILPKEIEEEAKLLRRNFTDLRVGKLTDGSTSVIIESIEKVNVDKGIQQAITFVTKNGKHERLLMHEKVEPYRGKYPMTEFLYNDKIYSSLPLHGDVLNHTFNQQEVVVKELLTRAKKEGIISDLEFSLYEYYHLGHDIDEISVNGKDTLSFEKEVQKRNGELENNEYKGMLEDSGKFTEQQIVFSNKLFNLLDHKRSLVGGFEKLMYLVTALDAYEIKDQTNSGSLLTTAVISNNIKDFTKENTHDLTLYNLLGKGGKESDKRIPLSEIQPAKDYFRKNWRKIEECIQYVKEHKNDFSTGALWYIFCNTQKRKNKKVEEQNRKQLLKHLDESLISLQKALETIKKEQDTIIL